MFNFFKKEEFKIVAPVTGQLIPLSEVEDKVFSTKMMGDGFAVEPSGNTIVAPLSGTLESVFPTGHAVGIKTKDGIECIVHIGLDTVELNGQGFNVKVKQGQKIKAGEAMIEIDNDFIKSKGYKLTTMVVFPAGYDHVFELGTKQVQVGEKLV